MGKKHIMGPRVTKRRVRAALERLGGWMFGYGAPALWRKVSDADRQA